MKINLKNMNKFNLYLHVCVVMALRKTNIMYPDEGLSFFFLPASEFWGQLGKEVGGGPGAGVWQGAGFVVGQSGRGGWSRVHRGATVPQLPSVKGAANGGAASQAASVRGGGWSRASPGDAQCGWRRCRHAMTQGAAGSGEKGQNSRETRVKSVTIPAWHLQVESQIMKLSFWPFLRTCSNSFRVSARFKVVDSRTINKESRRRTTWWWSSSVIAIQALTLNNEMTGRSLKLQVAKLILLVKVSRYFHVYLGSCEHLKTVFKLLDTVLRYKWFKQGKFHIRSSSVHHF